MSKSRPTTPRMLWWSVRTPRAKCGTTNNHKLSFAEVYPMILKNRVSTKGAFEQPNICMPEMTTLLGCLKKSEFNEENCLEALTTFNKCVEREQARRKARLAGAAAPAFNRLPTEQLNKVMKEFPQSGSSHTVQDVRLADTPYDADKNTYYVKKTRV